MSSNNSDRYPKKPQMPRVGTKFRAHSRRTSSKQALPINDQNPSRWEQNGVPLLNIANVLTVIRLVLVPVFIYILWVDNTAYRLGAFGVFAIAALTDKLDGYLARSRNLVTDFGKLADGIADKALIISALLLVSWHHWFPWYMTILFIVREVGITVMRLTVAKQVVIAAGKSGKLKMVAQVVFLGILIFPAETYLPAWVASTVFYFAYILAWLALVLAYISALEYVKKAIGYRNTRKYGLIAQKVLQVLQDRDEKIAVAESLTGGILADSFVSIPGASKVFIGGVVAYDCAMKPCLLGVKTADIAKTGPVDEKIALQMAYGVAQKTGANWGLATTGVAGPGMADGHEPGTVWLAVVQLERSLPELVSVTESGDGFAVAEGARAEGQEIVNDCEKKNTGLQVKSYRSVLLKCSGDRDSVRIQAVYEAVRLLGEEIEV